MNYEQILNHKIQAIKPSGIRKFFDILEEMTDAISLGIGEPDFVTPWHIRDAGIYSLERGHTKYTSNAGMLQLRREIAAYLERRFDLRYDHAGQILVTVGGSEAIDLALRVLLEPGDEVIVPVPSFVCYGPLTEMAGGVPRYLTLKAEDEFRLTPEARPRRWSCPSPPTPPAAPWTARTWRPSPRCFGGQTSWSSLMRSTLS